MCGHLSMLTMNLLLAIQLYNGCVSACTPIHLSGRIPYLLSLITSVRQETVGVLLRGFFPDDPLWDGAGCRGTSTCCRFNKPPWFCTSLPTATTADLEVRICGDQESINDQEYINLIELYVK